jgi:beta-glucosidase
VKDPRVAWPFGHGLTYTKFEYKNLQLENDVQTNDDYVELTFQVRNTGTVKADEIAQIYLSPTTGDQHIRPIQLQGFARISLEPGQGKTITTRLFLDQFGYYSRKDKVREWTIDPGVFTVRVGASSQDIKLEKRLEITGKTITKPLRDHYFSETIISQ